LEADGLREHDSGACCEAGELQRGGVGRRQRLDGGSKARKATTASTRRPHPLSLLPGSAAVATTRADAVGARAPRFPITPGTPSYTKETGSDVILQSSLQDTVRLVRLAYQPPANSTFLSEQTYHQQSANSTFFSEEISTSHQPPTKRTCWL
jgi:hypothetical protein